MQHCRCNQAEISFDTNIHYMDSQPDTESQFQSINYLQHSEKYHEGRLQSALNKSDRLCVNPHDFNPQSTNDCPHIA